MKAVGMLGFAGRLGRLHYAAGVLGVCAAAIVFAWSAKAVDGPGPTVAALVATPLLLWCLLCLNARRLRDMGRTAWWCVFPFVAAIALKPFLVDLDPVLRTLPVTLLNGCFLLVLLLAPPRHPAPSAAVPSANDP